MITIKEIAQLANVSVATVSYVLNNTGSVSEETRKRVLEIVNSHNYRANVVAKSLRTSISNTVGVVVEDITVWNSSEIIKGISKYVEQNNKHLILTDLGLLSKIGSNFQEVIKYREKVNNEIKLLLSAQVDGIIYIGMHDREIDNVIDKINKPIMYTYCYTNESSSNYISYDNIDISYKIAETFIKNKHTRIAVICGSYDAKPSYKRFCGFKKALDDYSITLDPAYIKTANWDYEQGYKCAVELLEGKNPPTAIFAMNDLMAAGVLKAARELSINIPEELSVIGFDNRELSMFTWPALTTVKIPLFEMGYNAAQGIYQIVNRKKIENSKHILSCELIERDTATRI
ncbi:MAG: LacI family transcriptional regulator [Eubacterium sp.]|jgi:LacI family transcriptional regulator|nr:LacI family transcriptional regulator [Eubacterium sp.]